MSRRSVLERYGPTESAVGRESPAHEDYLNWLHRSEAPLGLDAKYKPNTKGYLQRLGARMGSNRPGGGKAATKVRRQES